MWRIVVFVWCLAVVPAFATSSELDMAIENARMACGNISNDFDHIKTMAGVNTAITGVGTAVGVGATAVGIAKVGVDAEADEVEKELQKEINRLNELAQTQGHIDIIPVDTAPIVVASIDTNTSVPNGTTADSIKQKQKELAELTHKSKNLGNWRTGLLATNTATNIAGTIIAGTNRVKKDLKEQITACLASVKVLSNVYMQARISQTATDAEIQYAENIVRACDEWSMVNIDSINSKSTGATVSSGIGAGVGLVGTIISASANSNDVRKGDDKKEKNLNTAANVMAGGATVASGVATIFNATQIGAAKRALSVAEKCEGALK